MLRRVQKNGHPPSARLHIDYFNVLQIVEVGPCTNGHPPWSIALVISRVNVKGDCIDGGGLHKLNVHEMGLLTFRSSLG